MRFEVPTVVHVRLYGLQKCYAVGFSRWVPTFERNLLCSASILKMEVVDFSNTLVPIYQTIQHYILETYNLILLIACTYDWHFSFIVHPTEFLSRFFHGRGLSQWNIPWTVHFVQITCPTNIMLVSSNIALDFLGGQVIYSNL